MIMAILFNHLEYDEDEFHTAQLNPRRLGLEDLVFPGVVRTNEGEIRETLRRTGFICVLGDSDDPIPPRLRGGMFQPGISLSEYFGIGFASVKIIEHTCH
jgi:hypothetical protein